MILLANPVHQSIESQFTEVMCVNPPKKIDVKSHGGSHEIHHC